jgi:hypothetical protein
MFGHYLAVIVVRAGRRGAGQSQCKEGLPSRHDWSYWDEGKVKLKMTIFIVLHISVSSSFLKQQVL